MGLFSRRAGRPQPKVMVATPEDLVRIGQTAFGGESVHPPGFAGLATSELDGYVLSALEASGHPAPGSPQWEELEDRFLDELSSVARTAGGGWAFVGAFGLALNFCPTNPAPNERYLQVMDQALVVLRDDGVAYTAIPPLALRRWESLHGTDGAGPAAWPRALEDVSLPRTNEPVPADLDVGTPLRLAQHGPAMGSNVIFGERRSDGQIIAVIEGVDPSDGERKRWEWQGVVGPDLPAFLRELGERLVTPTHWAHDALQPYFPCRARSRDEMRRRAALHVGPRA